MMMSLERSRRGRSGVDGCYGGEAEFKGVDCINALIFGIVNAHAE